MALGLLAGSSTCMLSECHLMRMLCWTELSCAVQWRSKSADAERLIALLAALELTFAAVVALACHARHSLCL